MVDLDLSTPKAGSSGLKLNRRQEAQLDQGYFRVGISIARSRSNIPLRLSQTVALTEKVAVFPVQHRCAHTPLQRNPAN